MTPYIYNLPQLIAHSAKAHPQKVAFRFMSTSITYEDLDIKANQLANQLIQLGIQKGDRVGIFMARSLETAIAMYGIMRAGAVYVPLNPMQPIARSQSLIEAADIQVLITNKAQKRNIPTLLQKATTLKTIIGLDQDLPIQNISWTQLEEQPKASPNINILEDDLAYILYTSGSTGVPKGIMHTHRSGLAYAKLCVATYELNEKDIFGNHAPIYFDISTLGFFAAPMVGATTVIASEAHIKMPASLSQLIEKEQVTVWYSVPLALMQMQERGALDQRDMSNLRWVIFAGEPFPTKHLQTLMATWPHARFNNAYGPTETNVCTHYHIPRPLLNDVPISIGQCWGNTEALILDENNEPVEDGEAGELLINSATLMAGYFGRPDLNEQAFYYQNTSSDIQKKYYRTGDLVIRESDGNFTFIGRKDRQIKTRGFRVELDEITNALLRDERVQEAAVYTYLDESNQTMIGAAIVTVAKTECSSQDILKALNQHLLWYAMPARLAILETLPRTSTQKVDLKRLQELI